MVQTIKNFISKNQLGKSLCLVLLQFEAQNVLTSHLRKITARLGSFLPLTFLADKSDDDTWVSHGILR